MRADKILGIELNEKFCQISYYEPEKHEPETLEVSVDNFQIPMILGKLQDEWVYGKDAVQLASVEAKCTVSDLYTKAVKQEKVKIGCPTELISVVCSDWYIFGFGIAI